MQGRTGEGLVQRVQCTRVVLQEIIPPSVQK